MDLEENRESRKTDKLTNVEVLNLVNKTPEAINRDQKNEDG